MPCLGYSFLCPAKIDPLCPWPTCNMELWNSGMAYEKQKEEKNYLYLPLYYFWAPGGNNPRCYRINLSHFKWTKTLLLKGFSFFDKIWAPRVCILNKWDDQPWRIRESSLKYFWPCPATQGRMLEVRSKDGGRWTRRVKDKGPFEELKVYLVRQTGTYGNPQNCKV